MENNEFNKEINPENKEEPTPIYITNGTNNDISTEEPNQTNQESESQKEAGEKEPNKFEKVLEFLFEKFSIGIRIIGPLFAFALTTFVLIVAHTFFNVILIYWKEKFGFLIKLPLTLMACYLLFSILFNYFLAVLVRPGSLEDLKKSKFYRYNDPFKPITDEIDLTNILKNPNNIENLEENDKTEEKVKGVKEIKLKLSIKDNTEDANFIVSNSDNDGEVNTEPANNLIDGQSTNDIFKELDAQLGDSEEGNGVNSLTNLNVSPTEINPTQSSTDNDLVENDLIPNIVNLGDAYNKKFKLPKNNQDYETIKANKKIALEIKENQNDKELEEQSKEKELEEKHEKLRDCKHCKDPKIVRSHHCQICGYCVFKMDHHCPWINNCVGLHNHRYFILFLVHILFGTLFVNITAAPISFSTIKKPTEFTFVTVLCFVGMLILIFFNTWNWFLVFRGNTTIEFWMLKSGVNSKNILKDFSFNDWRENLFVVFGTRSLFRAIFIPSYKKLPFSGIEWTKLEYKDFTYEFGELKKDDNIMIVGTKLGDDIESNK